MAGDLEIGTASLNVNQKNFHPTVVVVEPLPSIVMAANDGAGEFQDEKNLGVEKENPEDNDEFTGNKEAYMGGILAQYRKNLMERTEHHLGPLNGYWTTDCHPLTGTTPILASYTDNRSFFWHEEA
ncbi:hypothetical protein Gotur_014853 [Gossypium turneri]